MTIEVVDEIKPWSERPRGELMLAVLDFVLDEQIAGRHPTTVDVAAKFGLTIEFTEKLHDELVEMGELG